MAHRLAPKAETDLDDIWLYAAKESGSVEIADRLIDSITDRLSCRIPGKIVMAASVALLLCLGGCRHAEPERAGAPPRDANVLLITLDTTRADHLSCYGPRGMPGRRTWTLWPRAASGSRTPPHKFRSRLPSHACIMTGAYPTVHGLRDMGGFVLDKSHPTIASHRPGGGVFHGGFCGLARGGQALWPFPRI